MPADKTIDTVLMIIAFGLLTLGLGSMALGWVSRIVRSVTSNEDEWIEPIAASVPRTGPDQEPDRTVAPPFDKAKLLDTYRRLRALGASRNAARELLQIWGIPLHNDLWAKAAPEEEPALTPIAHRPTAAKFHEGDPELEYQPLR